MDKKRKVKATIENLHLATAKDLLGSEVLRKLLITETPVSIEHALQNKSSYATLFEINDTTNCVELHKRDWINALESCLKYHLERENYEDCSKINSIIARVKNKNHKITIKQTKDE